MKPKYPNVKVRIKTAGKEGNAFFILGSAAAALRRAGVPLKEVREFEEKAMAGNYDHLVKVVKETVATD